MNEREMLELAAKAAGYEVLAGKQAERDAISCGGAGLYIKGVSTCWNPLEDDGDALRLAVRLNMGLSIPVMRTPMVDVITFHDSRINVRESCEDPCAATRRAIVRAAAEIGKSMP